MATMRVGLMGMGRGGLLLAEALLRSNWCELAAVAHTTTRPLQQFIDRHPGVAAFDDYRSLIVSTQLDALFVAVPPFQRGKYLALAAERRLPVWMLTPPARSLEEAAEILERFEQADCPIVVSRAWGIEPALQPDALDLQPDNRVFLATGSSMTCLQEDLDWRGDSVRAGGGVLLDHGYALIDTIVQVMGMPGTVYTAAGRASRPATRFPYDTEDAATCVLQFPGGGIGAITCCWTTGPAAWHVDLHALSRSVHIDGQTVVVRDRSGQTETARYPRPAMLLLPQVEEFLSALRSNARILSTLRHHLPTLAVMQTLYLSARTGQPESPGRLAELHRVS